MPRKPNFDFEKREREKAKAAKAAERAKAKANRSASTTDDPATEYSTLSGSVTEDGVTVRVVISRAKDHSNGWALDVIDDGGTSTRWDDTFPTEQDAYKAFQDSMQRKGIRSLKG